MEEAFAWGISLILAFIVGLVVRSHSNGRTSSGTGSNTDRIRDGLAGAEEDARRAADSNQRAADNNRTATEQNERAQQLVGRARELLANARHTKSND